MELEQKAEDTPSVRSSGPMTNFDQKLVEMQKQLDIFRQENNEQLDIFRKENNEQLDMIRQENRARLDLIGSEMAKLMNAITIKIRDQTIQLQSEQDSGFVDAAPTVTNVEQQLTQGFQLLQCEEHINIDCELYACFYSRQGLFRVKIPSSRSQDIKIEHVILNDPTNPLPHCMAVFTHPHNNNIYMVGRRICRQIDYSDGVYVFDPCKFQKLPIQGLDLLDQPKELHDSFHPMMEPSWIQSKDQIYLISTRNYTCYHVAPFYFQTFDLTKNHFKTLEPPPFEARPGEIVGFFSLPGYIYLFIEKLTEDKGHFAFRFDPRSSQWKELTLHHFEQEKIPIPSSRIGDVGLSRVFHSSHFGDKGLSRAFPNNSQILVTLNVEGPTAYCIQICDDGSLRPNSYRGLDEIFIHRKYKTEEDYAHLHDIGQGRFCVVYRSLSMPLLIYVFKIDFEVELHIQSSDNKSNRYSSQVLYAKKCEDPIPLWDMHFFSTSLLASSTSNKDRGMAATSGVDKDPKKKYNSKSRRSRQRKKIQQL